MWGYIKKAINSDLSTPLNKYWENKTLQTSALVVEHYTNTVLDITGSGYLICLNSAQPTYKNISIQIDGGVINAIIISLYGSVSLTPIRFNTSLLVKADSTYIFGWVVLD